MTKWAFFAVVLLLLGVHAALVMSGATPVLSGQMPDSDTSMRLVRVEDLVQGQSWFDSMVSRMNAPYGSVLNWTRPLDVLIIMGAYPLVHMVDYTWHDALFASGAALPVLLHLIMAASVAWAAAPLLPSALLPLVMLITALQPYTLYYNLAGRPDHQTLLLIAVAVMLGGIFRTQERLKPAFIGGLAAGFGLWVSTEMEFSLLVMVGSLVLLWLVNGQKRWLIAMQGVAFGTLLMSIVGLFAERGFEHWRVRELDKLSLAQVLGVAVLSVAALLLSRFATVARRERWKVITLIGFGSLGWLWMLAPELLKLPTGDIDPRVMEAFFLKIREMRPLFPTTPENAGLMMLCLAAPLTGLIALTIFRPRHDKELWFLIVIYTSAFTLAGLFHARFSMFASLFASILLVEVMRRVGTQLQNNTLLLRVLVQGFILFAPTIMGLALAAQTSVVKEHPAHCNITSIAPQLQALPTGIIMATINDGAEILYRTPHAVVAAPYHRNRDGILDSVDFFATGNRTILARRGVTYVLVCADNKADFAVQLIAGKTPAWLKPIPLSQGSDFILYRVDE